MKTLKRIFFDESGSPALEYALILGLVGLAIVGVMGDLSNSLSEMMEKAAEQVKNIAFGSGSGETNLEATYWNLH